MLTEEQFNEAFKLYYRTLCHSAYAVLGDYDRGRDFVQDAFVRLWEERETSSFETAKAFLFIGMKNRLINEKKALNIRREYSDSLHPKAYIENQIQLSIEREFIKAELLFNFYTAINALPPGMKKSVLAWLEYSKEKREGEISRLVGVATCTYQESKRIGTRKIKEALIPFKEMYYQMIESF